MKKVSSLFLVLGILLGMSGFVMAYSTTTSLGVKDTGTSLISQEQFNSATHSAKLDAPFESAGPEGRVRITFNGQFTLNDLSTFSWSQYVTNGYASHVDVLIDTNNDGVSDDALVFEYDKVTTPSDQLVAEMTYARNSWINTFGSKGIVNDASKAWLTSGPPGPSSAGPTIFFSHTLNEWKIGPVPAEANGKTVNSTTKVIALEIEVDGWIATSESYIDDIMLNGALIENFEGTSQTVNAGIGFDSTLTPTPNPLMFNGLMPGQTSTQVITLTPGVSNLAVSVNIVGDSLIQSITSDWDGPFTLFSGDGFTVSGGTPKILNARLSVPIGTHSGSYTGTIIYTVLEA